MRLIGKNKTDEQEKKIFQNKLPYILIIGTTLRQDYNKNVPLYKKISEDT